MKSKQFNKQQRQQFFDKAVALVQSKGAVNGTTPMGIFSMPYDCELATPLGLLGITVRSSSTPECLGQVFTRFAEPEKAQQLTGCNEHSGKWNFHYFASEGYTVENALTELENHLKMVLTPTT